MRKTKLRIGSKVCDMADKKLREYVGYVGPSDTAGTPSLAYELSADGTYYIVTGRGTVKGSEIIIPDTYEGKPVGEVGYQAFYQDAEVTKITVGVNIDYIGAGAFLQCPKLEVLSLTRRPTDEEEAQGDLFWTYAICCEEHSYGSSLGQLNYSDNSLNEYLNNIEYESECWIDDEYASHTYGEENYAYHWASFA